MTVWLRTGLITDDRMLLHQAATGVHPERPHRLRAALLHLEATGLSAYFQIVNARPATAQELQLVHTPQLCEQVEQTANLPAFEGPDKALVVGLMGRLQVRSHPRGETAMLAPTRLWLPLSPPAL